MYWFAEQTVMRTCYSKCAPPTGCRSAEKKPRVPFSTPRGTWLMDLFLLSVF